MSVSASASSTTLCYKGTYIYTPSRQLVTCLVVPQ